MTTPTLADTQAAFAAALLDPHAALPIGLAGPAGGPVARRFAVYRNNVAVGLVEALYSRFPVTARLVGDAFFRGMARLYVASHRPQSPLLMAYGDDFADFVAGFEPAAELAYLPDVVRFEVAWSQAYHAAEADALDIAALAGIDPGDVAGLVLHLHPSVRLLRSTYPVASIWSAHQAEEVTPPDVWAPEDTLILRPQAEVLVHRLPPGGHAFLRALADGLPLGVAVDAASDEAARAGAPDFDISANLAAVFAAGAVIGAVCTPFQETVP